MNEGTSNPFHPSQHTQLLKEAHALSTQQVCCPCSRLRSPWALCVTRSSDSPHYTGPTVCKGPAVCEGPTVCEGPAEGRNGPQGSGHGEASAKGSGIRQTCIHIPASPLLALSSAILGNATTSRPVPTSLNGNSSVHLLGAAGRKIPGGFCGKFLAQHQTLRRCSKNWSDGAGDNEEEEGSSIPALKELSMYPGG